MKYFAIIFFAFVPSVLLNAQPIEAHQVKEDLLNLREDTTKLKALTDLSWFYAWSFPDTTLKYSAEGLKIAKKINSQESQVDLLTAMAQALAGKGNFLLALQNNYSALALSEKINNEDLVTWSYASIGSIYFYAEDYQNALLYFSKTKKFPVAFNNRKKLYLGFIGEAYFHLNQLDSALLYAAIL